MSDNIKINVAKVATILTIAIALATIVGAAYIGYDNAKSARCETKALEVRLSNIELDYAQFKGIMQERTENIQRRVNDIYNIVKEWQPETKVAKETK